MSNHIGWEFLIADDFEYFDFDPDNDGSWGNYYSDGSATYYGADGSEGTRYSDGSGSYDGADGSRGTRYSDGSVTYYGADGSEGTRYSDGTVSFYEGYGNTEYKEDRDEENSYNSYSSSGGSGGAFLLAMLIRLGIRAYAKNQVRNERFIEEQEILRHEQRAQEEQERLRREREARIRKEKIKAKLFQGIRFYKKHWKLFLTLTFIIIASVFLCVQYSESQNVRIIVKSSMVIFALLLALLFFRGTTGAEPNVEKEEPKQTGKKHRHHNKSKDLGCDWYCDNCRAHLNGQIGFTVKNGQWKCDNCGFVNDVTVNNIEPFYVHIISAKRLNRKRYDYYAFPLKEYPTENDAMNDFKIIKKRGKTIFKLDGKKYEELVYSGIEIDNR